MRVSHLATAVVVLFASAAAMTKDQTSGNGNYAIERYTVDSGGGVSSGGEFTLQGTIGQIDAGPALGGHPFRLQGGFWPGLNGSTFIDFLFSDRFESDAPASTSENRPDQR